jgi:hypothetical protein
VDPMSFARRAAVHSHVGQRLRERSRHVVGSAIYVVQHEFEFEFTAMRS